VTIREDPLINLGLDVDSLDVRPFSKTIVVDFIIEVTNVTDNSIMLHLSHMLSHNDVLVSCCCDKDVNHANNIFKTNNLEAFHAGLESTDGINFCDIDTGSTSLHGLCTSLSNISVTQNQDLLSCQHNISGSEDSIGERVTASVDVIKLLLGD
jgi:hypothetical protein